MPTRNFLLIFTHCYLGLRTTALLMIFCTFVYYHTPDIHTYHSSLASFSPPYYDLFYIMIPTTYIPPIIFQLLGIAQCQCINYYGWQMRLRDMFARWLLAADRYLQPCPTISNLNVTFKPYRHWGPVFWSSPDSIQTSISSFWQVYSWDTGSSNWFCCTCTIRRWCWWILCHCEWGASG